MPYTDNHLKLALALLLAAATGPAASQGVQGAKTHVANAAGISKDTPPSATISPNTPCPQKSAPVLKPTRFLVVNRTSGALQCRMRNPAFGGWSEFASVSGGARLIDKDLAFDEVLVQCKPPARIAPVRIHPGERYALFRKPPNTEVTIVRVVP
jgi:hypothetical protein